MSSVKITGNASGAGVFEIAAPNSATNRTQTLPDATGTVVLDSATQTLTNKTLTSATLTSATLTTPNINSAQFATVSGTAPIYACRAWVNFDGTNAFSPNPSTTAIRASGNVTSISDNGVGDYSVNFTTAMVDTNYSIGGFCRQPSDFTAFSAASITMVNGGTGDVNTGSCRIRIGCKGNTVGSDSDLVCLQIFR